ncbi:MAG: hypothetical protein SGBAC_001506 [Bacillariaceae sp.]
MLVLPWAAFHWMASFCLLLLITSTAVDCLSLPSSSSSSSSRERTVVLLFYKPPNVVTSHVSNDDRPTVYDQVQDMNAYAGGGEGTFEQVTKIRSKLHAIGRLDADTTGLLLLTNDGGLVHHVTNKNAATHDSNSIITKTYQALVMGHQTEDTLRCFWEGVDIGTKYGGRTQPVDDVQILEHPNHKSTRVSITISEGKNRQVRRMFHSIGSGVMQLKRVAIGADTCSLTLEGLQEGQWRLLSHEEVRKALQWETMVLGDKPSAKGRSKSGPKGRKPPSTTIEQRNGRRQQLSGKRRRRSSRANSTRTQR